MKSRRDVSPDPALAPGGDDPGRGGDARDSVDDEGLERVAHRIDDSGAVLGVLAKDAAEGTDLEGELQRAEAIVPADVLVVRGEADVDEAGGLEDPAEAGAGGGCGRGAGAGGARGGGARGGGGRRGGGPGRD